MADVPITPPTVMRGPTEPAVTDERIAAARSAGAGVVTHTPTLESVYLTDRFCSGDAGVGGRGRVVLKAENLQRTGSFKIRGAMAKLGELGDAATAGVVAGSAGNHAQALALAARVRGVPCEIFVPSGASISKTEATRGYGATVTLGGDSVDVAVALARERAAATGMHFCSPFDDEAVIAGQATLGLELLADVPDLRMVLVPLGGGGLASGVAIAVKRHDPSIVVIGIQVEACAPYADHPPADGPITTLADGIAVKRPGTVTRPLVEQWLDGIVTVDENAVADAMMFTLERARLVVEGAGAVGIAALSTGAVTAAVDGATCVILSGGNVDLGVLPGLLRRHETLAGRRLILFARISDRPGNLARLLTLLAEAGANLVEVEHVREGVVLHARQTGVQVVLEVRDQDHARAVTEAATQAGYDVQVLVRD